MRFGCVSELLHYTGLLQQPVTRALAQRFGGIPSRLNLYPLAAGVTFAAQGVAVDADARIRIPEMSGHGLFAAGFIMAPTLLGTGYLAGAGLSIAGVFGRIAGASAAHYVQQSGSVSAG